MRDNHGLLLLMLLLLKRNACGSMKGNQRHDDPTEQKHAETYDERPTQPTVLLSVLPEDRQYIQYAICKLSNNSTIPSASVCGMMALYRGAIVHCHHILNGIICIF
jgi:hypothetical protein